MYGGYGGMGGGMGGMGGGMQQQMPMLSSLCSSSISMLVLAVGAYMFWNNMKSNDNAPMDIDTTTSVAVPPPGTAMSTPSGAVNGLDGTFMVLVGSLALNVDGDCGSSTVNFRLPKDAKTAWRVRKAGTTSDGTDYYTLQSEFKSFHTICKKNYLSAPLGCKSPPFLSEAASSPSQYWMIIGSPGNYQLQSLACKLSRFPLQYLQNSGQIEKSRPSFSARAGSAFQFEKPYAG